MYIANRDGYTCPEGGWTDPNDGTTKPCVKGAWESENCDARLDSVICDISAQESMSV